MLKRLVFIASRQRINKKNMIEEIPIFGDNFKGEWE
jgi:hypothetical protein